LKQIDAWNIDLERSLLLMHPGLSSNPCGRYDM